jgi:hypothetical protein
MPIGNRVVHEPALPSRPRERDDRAVISEPASAPPPRLVVRDDLVAVWRVACLTLETAWRDWLSGAGDARGVLAALDREEAAARALASFCRAGV